MAIVYTSVAPGDQNDGWVGWRPYLDGFVVLEFFNRMASQSGDFPDCDRYSVKAVRGEVSYQFSLVESYSYETSPSIYISIITRYGIKQTAIPFDPERFDNDSSNDQPLVGYLGIPLIEGARVDRVRNTRAWLCEAYAWLYSNLGGMAQLFHIANSCPLDPMVATAACAPCFGLPGSDGPVPSDGFQFAEADGMLISVDGMLMEVSL